MSISVARGRVVSLFRTGLAQELSRRSPSTPVVPADISDRRLSRRRAVAAAGATALAGLAGCTLDDPPQVRCGSRGEGEGDAIRTFRAVPGEHDAYLVVGVPASMVPDGLDAVRISDGADRLVTEIPVQDTTDLNRWEPPGFGGDEVPFPVNLGPPPVHGVYRAAAIADGEVLATATLRFNCFVDAPS
jgi:hypothetical protein